MNKLRSHYHCRLLKEIYTYFLIEQSSRVSIARRLLGWMPQKAKVQYQYIVILGGTCSHCLKGLSYCKTAKVSS